MSGPETDSATLREGRGPGITEAVMVYAIWLLFFLVLFLFRRYDDNRLVSWDWVFRYIDTIGFFSLMVLGVFAVLVASRFRLPGPGAGFLLASAVGAFFLSVPEVIIDASRYFTQAKHLGLYGAGDFIAQWGRGIDAWTDLPLVPFIYGIGFRFLGEHRIVVQAVVLIMFASTAMLTIRLGSDLIGERAGRIAGVLFLSMPYIYTQVPLMMVDVPAMFFLVLAVLTFRRGLLRGGLWAYCAAPFALAMAFFTKYSLWPMLSVTLPVFILSFMEERRSAARALVMTAIFALLVSPVLWYYREVMASQIGLLLEYQRPGLGRWGEGLFSTFLYNIHPFVTIAAVASAFLAIRARDRGYMILAWAPVIIILLLDVRRIRYTIPLLPFIALMAAYAIERIRDQRMVRYIAYTSLTASFILASAAYAPFLQKHSISNLMRAGSFLDTLEAGQVRVLTMPQESSINPAVAVPLLDLYTQKRLVYDHEGSELIPPGDVERSSFRFSWQYMNPEYYRAGEGGADYIAVVSSSTSREEDGLEGDRLLREFIESEGVFRFRTFVRIYNR